MFMDRNIYLIDSCSGSPGCEVMAGLLQSIGAPFSRVGSGRVGIDSLRERAPGCVFLDVDAVADSFEGIFESLRSHRARLPIVVITGHADAACILDHMRRGACDLLTRPVDRTALAACLDRVFDRFSGELAALRRQQESRRKIEALTDRERDILQGLLGGLANKTLAYHLGISVRTIEMHRSHLMAKLGVQNLAQAAMFTFDSGMFEVGRPCVAGPARPDSRTANGHNNGY